MICGNNINITSTSQQPAKEGHFHQTMTGRAPQTYIFWKNSK